MGKPVKLTDQKKNWFLKKERPKRAYRTRPARERYLIVCEGAKTEPNYFKSLKAKLPKHLVNIEIEGLGANTLSLVRKASELCEAAAARDQPYKHTWVVFDRDSFNADDFDNAIHAAQSRGFEAAWSNEAFELWYLLHFEDRTSGMSRTEFAGKLSKCISREYKKNSTEMYRILQTLGDEDAAMRRATQLHAQHDGIPPSQSNPCTRVNKLVSELNEYKQPEV